MAVWAPLPSARFAPTRHAPVAVNYEKTRRPRLLRDTFARPVHHSERPSDATSRDTPRPAEHLATRRRGE